LENFLIPLPPLAEQRAIAHVLRTVQRAREACERVLAATRQLKQSLLHHLFTYGPVPFPHAPHVPLKETDWATFPAHWEITRLGKVADARGGTGFPPEHQGQSAGQYPFFKVSDMNLAGNETLMRRANNYIREEVRHELGATPFKPGTVIFPKVGGALHTNKKRMLTADSLLDNNLMGVTVKDEHECLPEFLFRWFETVNLSNLSNPGPLPSINANRVKATLLALPPLPEQREIARQLGVVDAKIAALETRRAALDALFRSLLEHLMTGRLRLPEFANAKPPGRQAAGKAGA
jgi:type I restriction enzyme S subunit